MCPPVTNPTTPSAPLYSPRGCGSSGNALDEAPTDIAEMPEYFLSLSPERLAGCWVACIVDAACFGFEPGPVARALVIVAERLHGVKFPEPPVGVLPLGSNPNIPASSPFSKQAEAKRSGDAPPPVRKEPAPPLVATEAVRPCEPPAKQRMREGDWRAGLQKALPPDMQACEFRRLIDSIRPNVGYHTVMAVRKLAAGWPEFVCEIRHVPGRQGPGTLFIRRVAEGSA